MRKLLSKRKLFVVRYFPLTIAAILVATLCGAAWASSSLSRPVGLPILLWIRTPQPTPRAPAVFSTPLAVQPNTRQLHAWLSREATSGEPLLYVGNSNEIVIFPEHGHNPPPIGTITDGVSYAWGLYVDHRKYLYVANPGTNSVTVYPPGATSPSATYSQKLKVPLYPAVDRAGNLFVSNAGDGTVVEYIHGRTTPRRILRTPGVETDGLNFDSAGNLYVAYRGARPSANGSIEVFAPNAKQGHILGMLLHQPQALVVDDAGNIIVVETGGRNRIDVFPPGSTTPSQQIKVRNAPTQIALNPTEQKLYISNFVNNIIYVGRYPLARRHRGSAREELNPCAPQF